MKLYIKNMACKSCKMVVKDALEELDFTPISVEMGEVETKENLSDEDKKKLSRKIEEAGLELLEKEESVLIEKIKHIIVDYIYKPDEQPYINFSDLLSKKLNYNYNYLSNLFLEVESTTISQYIIKLKVERIKELILFEEYTLTEIADIMNYSSISHLSNQFKKVTGLAPTHFQKLKDRRRVAIQDI